MKERITELLTTRGFLVRTFGEMRKEAHNNSQIEVGIYARFNSYEKIYIRDGNKTNVLYIKVKDANK